jgi:myosin-5
MASVWVAQYAPTRKYELVGWLPAVLIDPDERKCELEDGRVLQPPAADILPRNPAIQDAVDDLTALSYMHEPAVLHNLHRRFDLGAIYTYTGTILIAVNPYAKLPGLYGPDMMAAYCNVPLGKLSPHVYAIAEDAFRSMLRDERSQSILVSGESGAGKTETTKLLLQYFASVSGKGEAAMQARVLESTPLLEAFGNARTRFNDNSSRFGRFIKIGFSRAGQMRYGVNSFVTQ